MSDKIYQFKVGAFKCAIIEDGYREVPAAVFAGGVSEDERNRIMGEYGIEPEKFPLTVNLLMINTGQQRILVDTGIGRDIGIGSGKLVESLASIGIQPSDIDLIIVTHHHADHVGGIVDVEGNLNFPNARLVMSKAEWAFATDEGNLAQMDEGMRSLVKPSLSAIKDRVELIEGEQEIDAGVSLIPAIGHTVGHLAVLVDGGGEKLLHIVDAAHHSLQVKYPQVTPTFDALPDVSPQTRRDLFQKACDGDLLVATYHFDFPGLGHVLGEGDGLQWKTYGE